MSSWISVYTDEMPQLQNIVRSRNVQMAQQAIDLYTRKAGNHAKEATIEAIRRIVEGAYKPGPQPDGHTVIYAFEHLCRSYSRLAETIEIKVDQDTFPEVFDFVWKSKNDPFGLPRSPRKSPAWAHWNLHQALNFLQLFNSLDKEKIRERTDSDYDTEIEALCRVLKAATDNGQGVFVFFNE